MRGAVQTVDYLNLAVFGLLALVALRQWRKRHQRAALLVALTFSSLAVVVILGRLVPGHPHDLTEKILQRVVIAELVVFPYLLYRFTTSFVPSSRWLPRIVGALTALLTIWTFALPSIPQAGEPWPRVFAAYIIVFIIHWSVLSLAVAYRLWNAGRGQPTVSRRRMQMFALAATTLTAALVVSVFSQDRYSTVALASGILGTLSGLAWLLGLQPPALLRASWRRPEQRRLQTAIGQMMALARDEQELAERVLEPTAAIVGARAVAVRNAEGKLVASHGLSAGTLARLEQGARPEGQDVAVLDFPGGSLVVWTSVYAPFFGDEELGILRTLGAMLGVALDRARLFSQEHETRLALERADELKSEFVALAAHELRAPVMTINGFISTLVARRETIGEAQRHLLEDTLQEQGKRMGRLVEQLLDLSRLDAKVVAIAPQRFAVRQRVEELAALTAGAQATSIEIRVEPELEADADPQAFDRIVANLIGNAFRYGEPPVVIEAEQRDHHFRLRVQDNGPGVPGEFIAELFERFTRSGEGRQQEGTGLGLAIARSYAQAHHGELLYLGSGSGGACFELVLPAT